MAGFPNPIAQYPSGSVFTANNATDFDKKGHPGKWNKVINVGNNGDTTFTGSNFGAGAIIMTNTDATIHLSDGGSFPATVLSTNEMYELSISRVDCGASGNAYVFIRNQQIR